jgi:hypothetical protein
MLQQDTPFGCSIKASKTLITNGLRAYYILACDFWVLAKSLNIVCSPILISEKVRVNNIFELR